MSAEGDRRSRQFKHHQGQQRALRECGRPFANCAQMEWTTMEAAQGERPNSCEPSAKRPYLSRTHVAVLQLTCWLLNYGLLERAGSRRCSTGPDRSRRNNNNNRNNKNQDSFLTVMPRGLAENDRTSESSLGLPTIQSVITTGDCLGVM